MKCPNCRCEIFVSQTNCPYCGYQLLQTVPNASEAGRSAYMQPPLTQYPKERLHERSEKDELYALRLEVRILLALVGFCILLLLLLLISVCAILA